jgi:tetratricopeptide (TPR) repeat protein
LATTQELSDPHLVVLVRKDLSMVFIWQGRFEEARSLNRETLKTYGDLESTQRLAAMIQADSAFSDQYLGLYVAAREQAQFAIELLKDAKHFKTPYAGANAMDILGRVALAEGAYGDAERWFQECYPIYQAYDITNALGQLHACLGYTARGLDRPSLSQGHFYEAVKLAIPFEDFLSLTHALPGIALLFADQGEVERAVELYALAATQGIVANSKWFNDISGDAVARAAEKLPVEVVEAARERGQELDLWGTAEGLLVELEEAGWGATAPGDDASTKLSTWSPGEKMGTQ